MAPIVVEYEGYNAGIVIGAALCVVVMLWAVRRSDREVEIIEDEATDRITADAVASGD
ncbi:MAG: hypothetical protein GYB65_00730, partial [Chloroflexi bacterium]|nr:hypothetical protein [Chloroflexota bacterium]